MKRIYIKNGGCALAKIEYTITPVVTPLLQLKYQRAGESYNPAELDDIAAHTLVPVDVKIENIHTITTELTYLDWECINEGVKYVLEQKTPVTLGWCFENKDKCRWGTIPTRTKNQ